MVRVSVMVIVRVRKRLVGDYPGEEISRRMFYIHDRGAGSS